MGDTTSEAEIGDPLQERISPVDFLRAVIIGIFCALFDRSDITLFDDFFGLGGDSLLGETLIAGIEKRLGVILPLSILLEASTPEKLAEEVMASGKTRAFKSLVRVRQEGTGTPLFCVHGMDGEITFARHLAKFLPEGRPIYGLRAHGLAAEEVPIRKVPQMAASYIAELKAMQPEGPYLIAGQCGASVIAYEMAQQLVAGGDEVAGLILGDPTVAELPWLTNTGMELAIKRSKIVEKSEKHPDSAFLDRAITGEQRRRLVYLVNYGVVASYPPKPYAGATLMVYISVHERVLMDPKRGFAGLLPNLTSVKVAGKHLELFQENAVAFAAAISAFLDRVSPLQTKV